MGRHARRKTHARRWILPPDSDSLVPGTKPLLVESLRRKRSAFSASGLLVRFQSLGKAGPACARKRRLAACPGSDRFAGAGPVAMGPDRPGGRRREGSLLHRGMTSPPGVPGPRTCAVPFECMTPAHSPRYDARAAVCSDHGQRPAPDSNRQPANRKFPRRSGWRHVVHALQACHRPRLPPGLMIPWRICCQISCATSTPD